MFHLIDTLRGRMETFIRIGARINPPRIIQ